MVAKLKKICCSMVERALDVNIKYAMKLLEKHQETSNIKNYGNLKQLAGLDHTST